MYTVYPSVSNKEAGQQYPVVLVHGWGLGSSIWSSVLPLLTAQRDVYTVDMPGYTSDELSGDTVSLPDAYILVGFSLGGIVASLDSGLLDNAKGLITVSTNVQFLASQEWPNAMPEATFESFSRAFDESSHGYDEHAARALQMFTGLQCKGSPTMRSEMRYLREQQNSAYSPDRETLAGGLSVLARADLRVSWTQLKIPGLHQFGRCDHLVPVKASSDMEETLGLSVEVFDGSAHQPFLSEPDLWVDSINRFAKERICDG